jgi:trehalose 6-phosphate phosphatase
VSDAAVADPADPTDLAARILAAGARPPLVVLDHDGTLSPIAPTPDAATLPAAARTAVAALAARTEVVVLSGRGLDDLVDRLGDLGVAIVAEHGLRLRHPDGTIEALATPPDATVLARLRTDLGSLLGHRPGWLVEDKGVGLAVHHRLVPADDVAAVLPLVRDLLSAAARTGGGTVQDGHAVVELRAAGAGKGAALRHLAAAAPGRTPVMVGDDRTDEPALAAAEELGGVGVLVATAPRPTAASARLPEPDAVAALLAALADRLSRG